MPYIKEHRREDYEDGIDSVIASLIDHGWYPGDINYIITRIILACWKHNPTYKTANKIQGILDCAAREFYRRVVTPYEDDAIKRHGDVY